MSSLRREASFEMQGTLLPRASVTWEAPLLVNRFERGTAQPLVTLKKGEETITQLNGSITRLTTLLQAIEQRLDTLEQGAKEQRTHAAESHRRIWAHNDEQDATLADHETRLRVLESSREG